jgi:hypothetical protein
VVAVVVVMLVYCCYCCYCCHLFCCKPGTQDQIFNYCSPGRRRSCGGSSRISNCRSRAPITGNTELLLDIIKRIHGTWRWLLLCMLLSTSHTLGPVSEGLWPALGPSMVCFNRFQQGIPLLVIICFLNMRFLIMNAPPPFLYINRH